MHDSPGRGENAYPASFVIRPIIIFEAQRKAEARRRSIVLDGLIPAGIAQLSAPSLLCRFEPCAAVLTICGGAGAHHLLYRALRVFVGGEAHSHIPFWSELALPQTVEAPPLDESQVSGEGYDAPIKRARPLGHALDLDDGGGRVRVQDAHAV